MDNINFIQTGGLPLETDTLDFMQNAYKSLQALAILGGDNYILSGCTEVGASVTDGWVVIAGEVMPFKGGLKISTIVIREDATQRVFENGVSKNVYYNRYAQFGTGTGAIAWADIKRVPTLPEVMQTIANHAGNKNNPHEVNASQVGLGSVNNTSDEDKPLSAASRNALANKSTIGHGHEISEINGLQTALNRKIENREGVGIYGVDSVYIGDIAASGTGWIQSGRVYRNATTMGGNPQVADNWFTIYFPAALPSANYVPVCTLRSTGSYWNDENDVMFTVRNKTRWSFDLLVRELHPILQSFYLDYIIMGI